jgi:flagellar protein FlbD
MIHVTRLNGTKFIVNAELIEQVDSTPDTVITLTTGNNIIVRESVEDVLDRVIQYRGAIAAAARDKVAL